MVGLWGVFGAGGTETFNFRKQSSQQITKAAGAAGHAGQGLARCRQARAPPRPVPAPRGAGPAGGTAPRQQVGVSQFQCSLHGGMTPGCSVSARAMASTPPRVPPGGPTSCAAGRGRCQKGGRALARGHQAAASPGSGRALCKVEAGRTGQVGEGGGKRGGAAGNGQRAVPRVPQSGAARGGMPWRCLPPRAWLPRTPPRKGRGASSRSHAAALVGRSFGHRGAAGPRHPA